MSAPKIESSEYVVLVVDDQPMVIEAARRSLVVDTDARVHGCSRASEAVERALQLRPAVILQDLNLPDGDGLDLIASYRSNPALAESSIVVLSSTQDPQVKASAFARGAADYIEKLPPAPEFVARIQHHAQASRALAVRNAAMRALDEANARLREVNQELVVDIGAQRKRVEALAAVGSSLATIQDLEVLLGTILDEAARFSGATAGAVFISEGSDLRPSTLYIDGISRVAKARLQRTPIGPGTWVGEVAATGSARRVECVNGAMANIPLALDEVLPAKPRSFLLLPIALRTNTLGVLALCDANDDDGFSEEDERLLRNFAGFVAVALERAQTARSLIFRMVAVTTLRDPTETSGHVQRVAGVADILYTGWCKAHPESSSNSVRERDRLRFAAILHDVGKVDTPDAILKKPGKLDETERGRMQLHAEIGSTLFSGFKSELDETASMVALCHHERWDGTGYPRGLRGTDIPLFARIVSVADVYDALASRRAYKEPWPRDRVVTLFRDEAGKHFDPELAQILVDHIEEAESVRDAYGEPDLVANDVR